MVAVSTRLCDVLLATRRKRAEATKQRRVTVPGFGVPNGSSVRLDLDVSAEGETELNAMIAKAQKATVEAWAPILALRATREAHGRRSPSKPNPGTSTPAAEPGTAEAGDNPEALVEAVTDTVEHPETPDDATTDTARAADAA